MAATLALVAAPAAVGRALVAPELIPVIFGSDFAPAATWLRLLALALIPMFLNGLLSWALIAAGRAAVLPGLLSARIVAAFVLASILVPQFGAIGAAAGFVAAEALLLFLGLRACSAARFAVPVAMPLACALLAAVPMSAAVWVGAPMILPAAQPLILDLAAAVARAFDGLRIEPSFTLHLTALLLKLTIGVATYAATLAVAWRLHPRLAARLLGGGRL